MHDSVMDFCRQTVARHGLHDAARVLEVGSMNVNGSVRGMFSAADRNAYVGVDVLAGPGVDYVVIAGERLQWDADFFDVVVSTEALEHDPRPWQTVPEIARVLRPEGHLVLTARGVGCGFHHPPDYWRYTQDAFRILLGDAGLTILELLDDPQDPGVFAVAVKP